MLAEIIGIVIEAKTLFKIELILFKLKTSITKETK
jgi:hypothetical protein